MTKTLIKLTVVDLADFGALRAEIITDERNRSKAEELVMGQAKVRTYQVYANKGWSTDDVFNGLELTATDVNALVG